MSEENTHPKNWRFTLDSPFYIRHVMAEMCRIVCRHPLLKTPFIDIIKGVAEMGAWYEDIKGAAWDVVKDLIELPRGQAKALWCQPENHGKWDMGQIGHYVMRFQATSLDPEIERMQREMAGKLSDDGLARQRVAIKIKLRVRRAQVDELVDLDRIMLEEEERRHAN